MWAQKTPGERGGCKHLQGRLRRVSSTRPEGLGFCPLVFKQGPLVFKQIGFMSQRVKTGTRKWKQNRQNAGEKRNAKEGVKRPSRWSAGLRNT